MNFKQYLAESEKTYNYRVKTVATLEKEHFSMLEHYLKRFNLIKVSPAVKTILQKQPLDFGPNIQNAEVLIIDIQLGLPLSPYVMEKELTSLLGLPAGYLLARGEFDALDVQTDVKQQQDDIAQQASKKSLEATPLLGTDPVYPEAEQTAGADNYYGDAYNNRLIGVLKKIEDERKEAQKVDAPAPLFSWLDLEGVEKTPDDNQAFNAAIVSAPKKIDTKGALEVGSAGEFTDTGKTVKKTFATSTGKTKTLAGKTNAIRKD